ncbi:sodium:solute symporter [Flavilitoribacter nigricans]|uniref:Sodium:solute symporter n=1 Tax=Flavilitoribacter nigricans (strain ATCC 23147 / DSM 23189 / NBRC 102662 / NCIMB 1420 / SS-2) TaxID=1122177 RepID=A0A2D0NIY7_FLAN2|nr:sodium:solute symporter [Flavilitoribacter nigricans]PHN08159.1 sodium:solute symporter [Flavilitoribacter nigricans DSM 23189 = NBRC 102662]
MSPAIILVLISCYIGLLYVVSYFSSRHADADSFYLAGRSAPWPLVSYGMIGVAISGITFISVPGEVVNSGFSYFQLVIGYALGLMVVAWILLPLFYRKKVISIYTYLEDRFGDYTHKSGAAFFLLAHLLGASFRLYLMAYVLQLIVFDALQIPFAVTVFITLMLIWLYTQKGGIQTVIFTDVLQTTFLLLAAVVGIWAVANALDLSVLQLQEQVWQSETAQLFHWSWSSPDNFFKLVITGMLLTIVSNGLDQAIMQKHLTCPSLGDAQKNIFTLSIILLAVNLLFLALGGSLFYYVQQAGLSLPEQTDQLYPTLAVDHLGYAAGITFIIGIAAAAYSSADSSLTGLTTAFCVDFLGYQTHRKDNPKVRRLVHLGFSILIFLTILVFRAINDQSTISMFIKVAGYAYGPLLGLFAFGMLTRLGVRDRWVPLVCISAPILSLLLERYSTVLFGGYQFGYEIILVNGLLTFAGLLLIGNKEGRPVEMN